jgi:hypothetical protein
MKDQAVVQLVIQLGNAINVANGLDATSIA